MDMKKKDRKLLKQFVRDMKRQRKLEQFTRKQDHKRANRQFNKMEELRLTLASDVRLFRRQATAPIYHAGVTQDDNPSDPQIARVNEMLGGGESKMDARMLEFERRLDLSLIHI